MSPIDPIIQRVRIDRTARKIETGSVWTHEPLTPELIAKHLNGGPARGCCPIKPGESTTMVALFDLDSHKGETPWPEMQKVARSLHLSLQRVGLEPQAFRSSGGKGIHIIVMWGEPQDAYSVRAYLRSILAAEGFEDGTAGVAKGQIEVFPKQDYVPADGCGSMFILPLAGQSIALDSDMQPLDDFTADDWRNSEPVPMQERPPRPPAAPIAAVPPADLVSALASLNNAPEPLDYEAWRNVIFAIHHELGEDGYGLASEWSAKSPKHDEDFLRDRVWPYIKPGGGITGKTIIRMAMDAGWVNPAKHSNVVFGPVDQEHTELLMPPDFSDDMLALDFVTSYGAGYRWSPGLGWMHDAGTAWRRDEGLTRYDLTRRICRAAAGCAKSEPERKRLTSAKTVAAVLSLAQSDQRIVVPASAWDGAPLLLNTPAGIVDLQAGTLRPRRSDDYVTQAARVAPDFDRAAPTFNNFMLSVFGGDHEMVGFMQRALGYCLTGDRREQVLFFWHGAGSNGKSTLLDLVQWLLGDYVLKMPAAALMVTRNDRHPTELAQLRGKRIAISSELEEGQFWNEALIKELTGDEVLTARFMRQDFFEFAMSQKHIIVGNHKPRLRGGDPAIARRLVLVPFVVTFEGHRRDRAMLDKLKAEAPAIVAWLVRGAVRWHREGLGIPGRVRDAGAEYLADHDDVAQWLDECCVRSGEAKVSELYASFKQWKSARGEHAPSQTAWAPRLQALPGVTRRRSNGWRYAGIALHPDEERRVRYGN